MRLAIIVAVAACGGSKSDAPAVGSAGSTVAVASVTPDAAAPPATKRDPPKRTVTAPTKAQLADYRKHIKKGWALQKQSKWAEAVPEFDKALVAIDGDQRALTELGYSAMNAGDFVKARKADEQAIQVASDKKTKAMALYNMGLV